MRTCMGNNDCQALRKEEINTEYVMYVYLYFPFANLFLKFIDVFSFQAMHSVPSGDGGGDLSI